MKVTGPANKRKGVKKGLKAPHPMGTDAKFGNKTDYAAFAKSNPMPGAKGGKKK